MQFVSCEKAQRMYQRAETSFQFFWVLCAARRGEGGKSVTTVMERHEMCEKIPAQIPFVIFSAYYRGAAGYVLVYDVTDFRSFIGLFLWILRHVLTGQLRRVFV